jgi:hypothetical protein
MPGFLVVAFVGIEIHRGVPQCMGVHAFHPDFRKNSSPQSTLDYDAIHYHRFESLQMHGHLHSNSKLMHRYWPTVIRTGVRANSGARRCAVQPAKQYIGHVGSRKRKIIRILSHVAQLCHRIVRPAKDTWVIVQFTRYS